MTHNNPGGEKGAEAERQIANWFRDHGWPHADKRSKEGRNDRGDVGGLPCVAEVKDCHWPGSLGAWVDEANKEAGNAGVRVGAVVHHRKGKGTANLGSWYVTMDLDTFNYLLHQADGNPMRPEEVG